MVKLITTSSIFLFLVVCQRFGQGFKFTRCVVRCVTAAATLILPHTISPAYAATVEDRTSLERFEVAYKELVDLDQDWNKIVQKTEDFDGNGDSVRRWLGTVYKPPVCDRALCSFSSFTQKFVNSNYDSLGDVEAFESIATDINEALTQADFLAYSAIFNEFSSAKKTDYIGKT